MESQRITESAVKAFCLEVLENPGYPPDLEKIATENILKQAELLADEFAAM